MNNIKKNMFEQVAKRHEQMTFEEVQKPPFTCSCYLVVGCDLKWVFVVVNERGKYVEVLPLYDWFVATLPRCCWGGAGCGEMIISPILPLVVLTGSSEPHSLLDCWVDVEVGKGDVVRDVWGAGCSDVSCSSLQSCSFATRCKTSSCQQGQDHHKQDVPKLAFISPTYLYDVGPQEVEWSWCERPAGKHQHGLFLKDFCWHHAWAWFKTTCCKPNAKKQAPTSGTPE